MNQKGQEQASGYRENLHPATQGQWAQECVSPQDPLPCSLPISHLGLTLASVSVCLSGRGRDTGPSTAQHRTSEGLICSYTQATTSAIAPRP